MFKRAIVVLSVLLIALQGVIIAAEKEVQANPIVKMEIKVDKDVTADIIIELFQDKAPETVKNFLEYVKDGFYVGTIFHRVIDGFMIQGGGFEPGMVGKKTRAPIKNEAHNKISNTTGTVAMARTSDVDSATAQFFINVNDNAFLDFRDKSKSGYGYTVFGKVIEGMDVVNKIKTVKTTKVGYFSDVPENDVVITKVTVLRGVKKKA